MKIQNKFLIVLIATILILVIPNIIFFEYDPYAIVPVRWLFFLTIARFVILIALFFWIFHLWIIKPLNAIIKSLAMEDPDPVKHFTERKDELGQISTMIERFFAQRHELAQVIQEKSNAIDALAQSESKARMLLSAFPDLLFRINLFGIITDYHAPDRTELLVPPEEFLGKSLEKVIPGYIVKEYNQAIQELVITKQPQVFEYPVEMSDGNRREYEATVTLTSGGDYLVVIRNITLRTEAEREINRTLEKQDMLNQLKTKFISTVFHEFRTPIAAISSNIQLLTMYQEKWSLEKKVSVCNRIQDALQVMIRLLDEVSLISRDQSGKLSVNLTTCSVKLLLRELIEELQKVGEYPVQVELQPDSAQDFITTDPELLKHILKHVISNACKFSTKEKSVHLTISRTALSRISFTLTDEGIGIPEADLPHIYEPFYKGGNTGEFPGAGLGMTIVKRCVDLLGGSLRIQSRENLGTMITISIPDNTN